MMDPYGYLHEGADTYTVTQLDEAQKEWLQQNLPKEPSESLFTDKVTLQTVDADHRIADEQTVTLTAYADRLTAGTLTIPYEQISGMAINQRNLLLVHLEGRKEHLQCKGPVSFNALKYLYLYRLVCPNEGGVL